MTSVRTTAATGGETSVELRLPATPENVIVARQAASGFVDTFGWAARFADDIRLAISEACTNVVQHAYRHASAPGEMCVSLVFEAGSLVVQVTDRGQGFAVGGGGDGLGLGIALMRTLADDLQVRTAGEGTEVRMAFSPLLAGSADE